MYARSERSMLGLVSIALGFSVQSAAFTFLKAPSHEVQSVNQFRRLYSLAADEEAVSMDEEVSAWKLRAMTFKNLDSTIQPALMSDFLMELGACSVAITDHDKDTELEDPIFMEPSSSDSADIFAAVVCGDAAVGKNIWMRCDVTAHFPSTFNLQDIADQVRYTFNMPTMPRYSVDEVPDKDWVAHVQSSWKPVVISGFVLKFPWHGKSDVEEAIDLSLSSHEIPEKVLQSSSQFTELELEGGIAFGTGEHPTTQLCLSWIRETLDKHNDISTFLDYGAGSGVLGIAACLLNDRIQSVGVEIDADAIRIADVNAKTNNVDMKSYLPRNIGIDDAESASLIIKALKRSKAETLPEDLDGPVFDACAANILAGPLISLAETIAKMIRPGGKLGLSGVLSRQGDEVVHAYEKYFDDTKIASTKDGWVLITGTRKKE